MRGGTGIVISHRGRGRGVDVHLFLSKEKIEELDKETPIYRGKVRELYNIDNTNDILYMKTSDRLSGFDRHLCNVPFKGSVLTSISMWWFDKLYKCYIDPIDHICNGTILTILELQTMWLAMTMTNDKRKLSKPVLSKPIL